MNIREQWRRVLARWVLGPEMVNGLEQLPREIRALHERIESLQQTIDRQAKEPVLTAADLRPVLGWIASAEAHLAALQSSHDQLRARTESFGGDIDRLDAAHATALAASVRPLLDWISGAEAHLASLQSSQERWETVRQRHAVHIDRLAEQLADLAARVIDLERADTEIASAVAKARLGVGR